MQITSAFHDGLHPDMPEDVYQQLRRERTSNLSAILRTPAHYRARVERGTGPSPATALVGHVLHWMVLERWRGVRRYAYAPLPEVFKEDVEHPAPHQHEGLIPIQATDLEWKKVEGGWTCEWMEANGYNATKTQKEAKTKVPLPGKWLVPATGERYHSAKEAKAVAGPTWVEPLSGERYATEAEAKRAQPGPWIVYTNDGEGRHYRTKADAEAGAMAMLPEGASGVPQAVWDECEGMAKALLTATCGEEWEDRTLRQRMEQGAEVLAECAILFPMGELPFKCKIDLWIDGDLIDVKTTQDASPRAMARSLERYGYGIQAAVYHRGLSFANRRVDRVYLACVEKGSWAPAIYRIPDNVRRSSAIRLGRALDLLDRCTKANRWPGYEGGELPALPESLEPEAVGGVPERWGTGGARSADMDRDLHEHAERVVESTIRVDGRGWKFRRDLGAALEANGLALPEEVAAEPSTITGDVAVSDEPGPDVDPGPHGKPTITDVVRLAEAAGLTIRLSVE